MPLPPSYAKPVFSTMPINSYTNKDICTKFHRNRAIRSKVPQGHAPSPSRTRNRYIWQCQLTPMRTRTSVPNFIEIRRLGQKFPKVKPPPPLVCETGIFWQCQLIPIRTRTSVTNFIEIGRLGQKFHKVMPPPPLVRETGIFDNAN